jgi:tetratricopeptide (TPR) repeat protein
LASNYLKALQLTKQLEKKAQEASKFRKLADKEIADAEELIKAAKNMDANVAKAEAKLTEATSALASKEFKTALEHAQESKTQAEKAVSEHVLMVLDSTKNLVKLAKEIGVEAPDLDETLAKSDEAVSQGKYEVALEHAEKGWEVVDKLLNEKVSEAFTKAQSTIVMAKKMGQDVTDVESLLDKAREHTDKSEYEHALKFINDGTQQANRLAEDEISKLVENVMISIDLARRMDVEVTKLEQFYSEAQSALEGKEFENAINIVHKSQIESEKIVGKASTKIIRECEDLIKEAKGINAEVTKASLLYNKSKEAFKSKNFEEVYDYSNQIKEEVENAQFQCVLKTISLSRPKFITAKNIGANLQEAVKFLDLARSSLKDKKFAEAMEYARKGETAINKLISNYEGAKEELQLITQAISRGAKIGVDTTRITDLMKDAKRAFDAKDYRKAMGLISKCRENIEQAMYDHTMDIIKKSEGVISLGEKTDSEVMNVKEYLDQAMVALKAEDYDRAIELAKKSREEAGDAIKKGITKEIVELTSLVNTLDKGEEKRKCLDILSSAGDVLDLDNYEEAFSLIVECKTSISGYAKNSIGKLEDRLKGLMEMEGDLKNSEERLKKAKTLLEEENYPESLRISKETSQVLNHQQQKIVSDLASSIIESIQNAKGKGMDVSELNDKIRRANSAIGKKDYLDAYRIMTKSKEETLTFIGEHDELSGALVDLKLRIEEAAKQDIDVSSCQNKLEKAEQALASSHFDNVTGLVEECKSEITQLTITHSIQEKMDLGKKCIEIAKSLDMDTSEMELQLKKTVIYMNKSQFENALNSATITSEKAEELCNVKISDLLSNAYSMIIEAKKIGLDVLTVEVLYQKAEEALELRRYEKAAKYATQSLGEIEEIRDESQRTANIINLAGNYIQEAENIKADVSEAKKLLDKAFSELKNNEYLASIELGKKCIRIAKKAKEMKVSEAISSFQSIIEKSKRDGVDVSKAETLLEESKFALADEDYNEALRLAMQSESEVERVDLQKKMAAEIIAVTAAKLKEAEKKGIQADSVRKLLIKAATFLKNHDYVKALESALESGMVLSESTEEYERASTTLQAAQARVNESGDIGVDVKKAKELLDTAKSAFEEKNFTTSIKFAKETIKDAKRSYVGHLSIPIENCERLIKTAGDLGVNVMRANNMLNEAKAALEEESYAQVAVFTENCKRLIERDITRNMFEKLSLAKAKLASDEKKGEDIAEVTAILKSGESYLEGKEYINAAKYIQKLTVQMELGAPQATVAEEVPAEEEVEEQSPTPDLDLEPLISELAGRLLRISKSGIHTKSAEKLLNEAQGIMESDPDKAKKLIDEAEAALEKELEPLSPSISLEIDLGSVSEKTKWYEITLELTNSGKSVAKDVAFEKKGDDFEIEGLESIKILKANEKKEIPLKIKANNKGDIKFDLDITFSRIFDGKTMEITLSREVQIGKKAAKEPSFKKVKADKTLKCYACNGKIKPGFLVIECSCGNTYHEACGDRLGKCPMCGTKFKKKKTSAKKKLALKVG